jgi:hypothetical protein
MSVDPSGSFRAGKPAHRCAGRIGVIGNPNLRGFWFGGELRVEWTDPDATEPSPLESPWQTVRVVLSRAACITPMLPAPRSIASKSLKVAYLHARKAGSTALGCRGPSVSCVHAARQGMHSGRRRLDHDSTGYPAPSRPAPLPLWRLRSGSCRLAPSATAP